MDLRLKNAIEFCCMYHDDYFNEEFFSDDEYSAKNIDFNHSAKLSFVPGVYDDVKNEVLNCDFEETSAQCEFRSDVSLNDYSKRDVFAADGDVKIIIPKNKRFNVSHTAKLFFKDKRGEENVCSICGINFMNELFLESHRSLKHK